MKGYIISTELNKSKTPIRYFTLIDEILSCHQYTYDTIIYEIEDIGTSTIFTEYVETDAVIVIRQIDPSEYNSLFTYYKFDDKADLVAYAIDGFSCTWEYDDNHNHIKYTNSNGYYETWKYDNNTLIENKVGINSN